MLGAGSPNLVIYGFILFCVMLILPTKRRETGTLVWEAIRGWCAFGSGHLASRRIKVCWRQWAGARVWQVGSRSGRRAREGARPTLHKAPGDPNGSQRAEQRGPRAWPVGPTWAWPEWVPGPTAQLAVPPRRSQTRRFCRGAPQSLLPSTFIAVSHSLKPKRLRTKFWKVQEKLFMHASGSPPSRDRQREQPAFL